MDQLTLPQLLEKYLQYCQVIRNYSPVTLRDYRMCFKMFFRETDALMPINLSKDLLEKWFFNGRIKRNWSPTTFRHYLKRINTFLTWLLKEGHISVNYATQIEKPRMEHKLPKTVSKDQAQLILDASFHMSYAYKFERYRNRVIIGLMLLAGLRKREVIELKLNDVSMDAKTIFIQQSKGNKDRLISINSKLHSIILEYLKDRTRLKRSSIHLLTTLQSDSQITDQCIKHLINRIRTKTKVDFSAHTLRHGFARLMLEGGCDIYTLSKLMGHAKITTTTIYLSCSNQQMSKSVELHSLN
jgi:site-specific recombinase XerD